MSDPFQNILPNIQIPQCQIHNLPGIFMNPDQNDKQRPVMCVDCIKKLSSVKTIDDQINEILKIFQDIQSKNMKKIDILNSFITIINEFVYKITQSVKKIIPMIQSQIDKIKTNQTKQNELFVQSKFISIDPIIQTNQEQNKSFQEFNKYITESLKTIKQNYNIETLIQSWQSNEQLFNMDKDPQKFQFSEILSSIQQNEFCSAIAINPSNSIVAAGFRNKIRIFELKNDELIDHQQLEDHSKDITCLSFMKKSQQLVSACFGGQIIIWELSKDNKWIQVQMLNEHKQCINCLQINQNEDLIISGSDDKIIKFWRQHFKFWKCDQTLQMVDWVCSLSLNDCNSKMIVSIRNQKQIIVMENDGVYFYKTQTIQLSKNTNRICFINDSQFAAQLFQSDLLQIFNFDQKDKQFKLGSEIKVKYGESDYTLFPMQYIKSNGMLIDKNCQFINIFRQQNNQFILDQIIDFGHKSLYGCGSDDGQYLFTWDYNSYQIQVRKLELI